MTAGLDDATRRRRLTEHGADESCIVELLDYCATPYIRDAGAPLPGLPLSDEPHLADWREYAEEAAADGALEAVRRRLIQFRFPVEAGISATDTYSRATKRGSWAATEAHAPGLTLRSPETLELALCPSMGGTIPVLVARDRQDFETLVQALTSRNEPDPVPASMGACVVTGLNNWDRVDRHRARWEAEHGGETDEAAWMVEFRNLIPRKELYQDRLILLSRGPYSATSAEHAGMDADGWSDASLAIRREHEFTHYFTYRMFGIIRTNALDELIADFMGIGRALGTYRGDLARQFLGLERYPEVRLDGRLESYRGDLSDAAMGVVRKLAFEATRQLERVSAAEPGGFGDLQTCARWTLALAGRPLEALADDDLPDDLRF